MIGHGTASNRNVILFAALFFLLGLAGSFLYFQTKGSEPRTVSETGRAEVEAERSPSGPAAESIPLSGEEAALDPIMIDRRNALVRASEIASPSVVSLVVYTPSWVAVSSRELLQDLFDFPIPGRTLRPGLAASIGSGLIVDDSGIILTNEHVVRNAEQILINIPDGRTVEAQIVGFDAAYDLAVLKMDPGDTPLPEARIGNSDDLMVGEWAIAIGNPFGSYLYDKQHTVTVGVISALHRDVKDTRGSRSPYQPIYKDMIQTDAAINPGNSGGPLVNSRGEVIGLNTFIFTQGGGSLGIGFAIPINTAVRAAREIIQFGHVRHVNLGIYVDPMSAAYAATLGTSDRRGLVIRQLDAGSPGAEAGLEIWDIIRKIDGALVTNYPEAQRRIFGVQVGDTLHFTVERSGALIDVPVLATADAVEAGAEEG
jgi:serine protease Do